MTTFVYPFGKTTTRSTIPDAEDERPLALVQRKFVASRPNQLWVADFTYVASWAGMLYVAFIIDVFSRMILGWRVSGSMTAELTESIIELFKTEVIRRRRPCENWFKNRRLLDSHKTVSGKPGAVQCGYRSECR